ncbi:MULTISPECIES: DUF1330 domain-containing protein [unclassified Chelatococcus]|uniref:DUF1330 domain-containing protein n=1 Tax=unclassified Chelatococcus TaxID=2638111 RepID=UPI001BD12EE4|nr:MULTISPECIES: DUF1330 domain-containing protein [unclassified Chelatococcus]CAH1654175.1 D-fructose-6-phosphate amidotransferase [Hyphomicrobiales bacterium]MBS7740215.1 DUF1330 domain-containing protein [Chelatococcus sp. HY11]MBX3544956.1 DUF1330 domain-containing protein [Chelatococcus sp.]MCO5078544.1 DUF1330 domain-containing protein [Chelatococcus sp.]CAH1685494.1 D-fructose-6-phosphate amidotransferase [Hyphomicrobiales bacterium]
MPAYVVIEVEVTDPTVYEEYRVQVPATIQKHGGKPLARGFTERLEGDTPFNRMSVIEFPDAETARTWFESDEVRILNALRQKSARSSAKLIVPS